MLKLLTIKTDGKRTFVILGGENQGHIHYAMPVKDMLYDALNYSDQVDKIAKDNRDNGRLKDSEATKGEYLSGLLKTDRIHPIITLVIYFGADKWDGPLSLHEMFDMDDELFLQFVPDYKLNLITPYDIGYDDFDKFSTDLKKVLLYIKMSSDKKKLKEEVHSNPDYWTVEPAIGKLMDVATGSKLRLKGKGGMVQMWNAIDEIKEEGRAEGKAEGRAEGIAEGKAEGRAEGIAEGRTKGKLEGKIETIVSLIKNGIISPAIGAAELGITESELFAMPQMQPV